MKAVDLPGRTRVLIVGHGQLGSAIALALAGGRAVEERSTETDWSGPAAAARSVERALDLLPHSDLPVTLIWAAGRCGMSSTDEECAGSLATMSAVCAVLARLRPRSTHLLGSVGALALGHPRWSPDDPGHQDLPYARLKLAEEERVAEGDLGDAVIHRIASVYGPPERPGRQGMITALVTNAAELRTTRIYGRWSTVRNYVHADDVAGFVAEHVVDPRGPGVHVLAARRSHAIAELVSVVSRARRRPVPVRLVPASNDEDLTIDPGAIAPAFRTRPLETAISQMVLGLRQVPVV